MVQPLSGLCRLLASVRVGRSSDYRSRGKANCFFRFIYGFAVLQQGDMVFAASPFDFDGPEAGLNFADMGFLQIEHA